MKILILLISMLISLPIVPQSSKPIFAENTYYYTSNVEHMFTHCLIAYPEIAFKNSNPMKKHYDADCITYTEFENILIALYENNYALVSINECFSIKDNIAVKEKIKMPIGKKPLILGFDDVNYDIKKLGKGMVDKIIVDNNENLASQTVQNEKIDISYNKEFVCILEKFIKLHPDFSVRGARGIINLTGYDGILGYRTSKNNTTNRETEVHNCKKVVSKLKQLGWEFSSHSYGHYHMKKISLQKFEEELSLWKNEVEPIVGKTQIYTYPYGEWEVFENGNPSPKHNLLTKYGFKLFCGVGMKTFYSYLPNQKGHKILFMDRKCIDGNTLKSNSKELQKFFNPLQIINTQQRQST